MRAASLFAAAASRILVAAEVRRTRACPVSSHLHTAFTSLLFSVFALRFAICSSTALTFPTVIHTDESAPNLTAPAACHSNATNAQHSHDQPDSLQIHADILASHRYPLP